MKKLLIQTALASAFVLGMGFFLAHAALYNPGSSTGSGGAAATTTVNSLSGAVTLQGAAGTSVTTAGQTITVSSTVGLLPSNNLSDVTNSSTARANLGVGIGSGNVNVTTSTVTAGTVPYLTTNNSSTISSTSSIHYFSDGDVSFGTTTDCGLICIVNASNTITFQVATTTTGNLAQLFVGNVGYATSSVSMGSCGSSPSVSGSNNGGLITTGSTGVSSCAMNFSTSTPWVNAPVCTINDNNTTAVADISSITSSTLNLAFASALTSVNVWYRCQGNPN